MCVCFFLLSTWAIAFNDDDDDYCEHKQFCSINVIARWKKTQWTRLRCPVEKTCLTCNIGTNTFTNEPLSIFHEISSFLPKCTQHLCKRCATTPTEPNDQNHKIRSFRNFFRWISKFLLFIRSFFPKMWIFCCCNVACLNDFVLFDA